jgi:hypothetical protein
MRALLVSVLLRFEHALSGHEKGGAVALPRTIAETTVRSQPGSLLCNRRPLLVMFQATRRRNLGLMGRVEKVSSSRWVPESCRGRSDMSSGDVAFGRRGCSQKNLATTPA